jgi:hypothetical protein
MLTESRRSVPIGAEPPKTEVATDGRGGSGGGVSVGGGLMEPGGDGGDRGRTTFGNDRLPFAKEFATLWNSSGPSRLRLAIVRDPEARATKRTVWINHQQGSLLRVLKEAFLVPEGEDFLHEVQRMAHERESAPAGLIPLDGMGIDIRRRRVGMFALPTADAILGLETINRYLLSVQEDWLVDPNKSPNTDRALSRLSTWERSIRERFPSPQ